MADVSGIEATKLGLRTAPMSYAQALIVSQGTVVPDYRAYKLDEDGHIVGRTEFICDDDATAQEKAESLVDGHDIELWQRDRKIVLLKKPG